MNNEETNNAQTTAPSTKPVRKSKTLLDPNWFQETCKLAIKHGTNLIFTEDRVWGVSVRYGNSVCAEYPPNAEWCKEISDMFAGNGTLGQFGDTNDNSALKAYANIALDAETSKCYVDHTTHVVHFLGANGVKLKSGSFTDSPFLEAPEIAPEVEPFVYSDAVPKQCHEMIVSCHNPNETRDYLRRVNSIEIDGVNGIVSTDGRGLVRVVPEVALPDNFNFDPQIVNACNIVGFLYRSNKKEMPNNHFKFEDGVVLTETLVSSPNPAPNVDSVIASAFNSSALGSIDGEFLKSCFSQIEKLGVGSRSLNRTVCLSKGKLEFSTENGVVLSFDGSVDLPEGKEVILSFERKCLRQFAKLGLDLNLAHNQPQTYKDENLSYLVMPILKNNTEETTDEQ